MSSASTRPTFSDRYCQHHELATEQFTTHLLRRSLHAPLRWFWPVLRAGLQDYLEPDIICVRASGRLTKRRELEGELAEFSYHPRNRSFWRRVMKQRLSTRRLRRNLRDLPDD